MLQPVGHGDPRPLGLGRSSIRRSPPCPPPLRSPPTHRTVTTFLNHAGLTQLSAELAGKRLELLKETVPYLARVAVLWTATSQPKFLEQGRVQAAAQVLGLQVQSLPVRDPSDVAPALESALSSGAEALVPLSDPLMASQRTQVIEFAIQHRLPAVYDQRDFVDQGGLLSYGANITDLFRRAAAYVDKILRGTNPADLPVERPTRFDFVINLKTAQALGLTIPQSILMQATEVIQ